MDSQHEHTPLLVQAPVRALDPDGTAIITAGTTAFAIAAGVLWLNLDVLAAAGQSWWLWVCVTGVGLGAIGTAVSWTRSHRRKRTEAAESELPVDAS